MWREADSIYNPDVDPAAVLFPMGTKTSKAWAWTLGASVQDMQKAGVDFDPDVRTMESVQGKATSGSALEVNDVPYSISQEQY